MKTLTVEGTARHPLCPTRVVRHVSMFARGVEDVYQGALRAFQNPMLALLHQTIRLAHSQLPLTRFSPKPVRSILQVLASACSISERIGSDSLVGCMGTARRSSPCGGLTRRCGSRRGLLTTVPRGPSRQARDHPKARARRTPLPMMVSHHPTTGMTTRGSVPRFRRGSEKATALGREAA